MSEDRTSFDRGMEMRRRVLGDDHVDRAAAATSDLDRVFQTWITEKVWADLWTRPELEVRDRSLVTIAILAALDHEELELHLEAARNTGVSTAEIGEVLLHVATYAGVPSANRAFKVLKDVYDEE